MHQGARASNVVHALVLGFWLSRQGSRGQMTNEEAKGSTNSAALTVALTSDEAGGSPMGHVNATRLRSARAPTRPLFMLVALGAADDATADAVL